MTPEVHALLEKARASRRAAILLAGQDYLDFAASRAYYALFYIAEALLLSQGLSFSSHAAVIAAFGKEFAKPRRLDPCFHRYLIDAQDIRIQTGGFQSLLQLKAVGKDRHNKEGYNIHDRLHHLPRSSRARREAGARAQHHHPHLCPTA